MDGAPRSILYGPEFALLQFIHGAGTAALRRDCLPTVFGGFAYGPFTVQLEPTIGYIRWSGLKQAKRLTARVDSKHAGLAPTV
jgi:hypothetical protein